MPIALAPHVLVRAPLLPARELPRALRALRAHPLGRAAIAVASPSLAATLDEGKGGDAAARAADRYARRAAFRATPAGLLAGTAWGRLARTTRVATGEPEGTLSLSWARLVRLARALLDDPDVREHVQLARAPSLIVGPDRVRWLSLGVADHEGGFAVQDEPLDEVLAVALDALVEPAPWPVVRDRLAHELATDATDADELLLVLVDRELVFAELAPPLVGDATAHVRSVLARLADEGVDGAAALVTALDLARAMPAADVAGARAHAQSLPGDRGGGDLVARLTFAPRRHPTLARRAVQRAAELAPFLLRLQEALAPPVAEAALPRPLLDALAATAELHGEGAYDAGELALGSFGIATDEKAEAPAPPRHATAAVVAELVGAMLESARQGDRELVLVRERFEPLLPSIEAPRSFELFLTPAREPDGTPAGTGWMVGLHGPAGASWGRAADCATPIADLRALQSATGAKPVAVAFAPSAPLADVTVHPRVGPAILLVGPPSGAPDDLSLADLELVLDASSDPVLGVRRKADGAPLRAAPFHRVRSTLVPGGIERVIAGASLLRQHAPWSMTFGPLGDLAALPRVVVDGFVIAPASWRIPARDDLPDARALARWRRLHRVPRHVQVGHEDELLPVDLADGDDALEDLHRHAGERAFEIWPPLHRLVDDDGRRIEAVVAAVVTPDEETQEPSAARDERVRAAGRVLPPHTRERIDDRWRTYKLFGPQGRQDVLLAHAVAPALPKDAEGWFFVRYVDPPAERQHLRVRVCGSARVHTAFERGLRRALEPLRRAGAFVAFEIAGYERELARYGGEGGMAAAERLFRASSELALVYGEQDDVDRIALTVCAHDLLAAALGLSADARRAFARRRRDAHAGDAALDEADAEYRRRKNRLAHALGEPAPLFTEYRRAVAREADALAPTVRAQVVTALPAILHMNANRLLAADRGAEALTYALWERTLESLAARAKRR